TEKLKTMRNLPPLEFLSELLSFEQNSMNSSASFPDVDTEANLWPRILERLLEEADLEIASLPAHNRALATLVSRRNKIAHGERDIIPEFRYYTGFED
ncbi:hypothetical protein GN156_25745, partial [bacterium LRH843]|nr:hypothetical protein [bacterium LRH843]